MVYRTYAVIAPMYPESPVRGAVKPAARHPDPAISNRVQTLRLCYTVDSDSIGEESCISGEETMPTTCSVLAPDDRRLVHELLAAVGECASVGQRLRLITARLRGAPYLPHPLVGSASEPEVFTVTLQGFDCVTLVETALALAWADNIEAFLTLLRQVRYRHGEIAWQQRLHYATDWLHHHVQHGRLSEVACSEAMQRITRRLDVLPGFPPHTATWRYFPTEALPAVSPRVVDGDIIFFVSMRQGLDVFHLGMLFRTSTGVLLRHAARSRGQVVEQELVDFCAANTMLGFLIAHPCEKPHYPQSL